MSDRNHFPPSDELEAWLDGDEGAAPEPAVDQRTADHLFLDALLERVYCDDARRLDASVQEVMNQINTEAPAAVVASKATIRRRRLLISGIELAAGVGGLGLLWLFASAAPNAHAAVARAITEAARPRDRRYRIETKVGAGPTKRIVKADLYTRGEHYFCVRHPAPLAGDVWFGVDGTQGWIVPSVGPVIVVRDPRAVDRMLKDREIEAPYVQIPPILVEMADRYELELIPSSADASGRKLQHIRGRRRAVLSLAAPQIDLWLDAQTGTVVRMVHDWQLPDFAPGIHEVRFELVDEEPLPSDWFSHARRHDSERPLLQFDVPQSKESEGGRP